MRLVASGATFTQRFVLKHERPELRRVTLGASFVLRKQRCAAALDRGAFVRIVAITATYFAFEHRVMVWEVKLALLVQVALKAGFRRFVWIDDRVARAAGLVMDASGTVAGLAPDVFGIIAWRFQPCVARGLKIAGDVCMTFLAAFRARKGGSGYLRWRHNDATDTNARDDHGPDQ